MFSFALNSLPYITIPQNKGPQIKIKPQHGHHVVERCMLARRRIDLSLGKTRSGESTLGGNDRNSPNSVLSYIVPPSPNQKGQIVCCITPPLRPSTTPIRKVTSLVVQLSGSLALFSQSLQSTVSVSAELGGKSSVYSSVSLAG